MRGLLKVGLIAAVAMVGAFGLPSRVEARGGIGVFPRTGSLVTNTSAVVIAASGQSNVVSLAMAQAIPVYQGAGMAIFGKIGSTNSSTSQVGISLVPSWDGTNYATQQKIWVIGALNGTTGAILWSNIPPSVLDNVKYVKVSDITNGHNASLFASNLVWSASP